MSRMTYIPGVGATLKTGKAIAGPTWAGGASALPAQPRTPRLGQPPRYPTFDGPPESGMMPGRGSDGGAYRGFHGQGGGGGGASWATRFAPDDGTKIKTKTQSDMGLSKEIGGLDGFYAMQNRSLDPFYRGSENSTGTSVPEVVGRAQEQGFSSGFGGSLLQNGKPFEPGSGATFAGLAGNETTKPKDPVTGLPMFATGGMTDKPFIAGEAGAEVIIPSGPVQVIPNNELNPAAGWAKGAFDVLPERAPAPMPAQQPALPLSQADWATPTARGVKSPEMKPAAGWASGGFAAAPDAAKATGQVASFAGADPGVQYSSPPPPAAPASFAAFAGQMTPPALPPGLSFADFRQAGREYYKTPQGIRDWIENGQRAQEKAQAIALEDQRYRRTRADELADQKANRDWQEQRWKASAMQDNQEAAAPTNVPEGYVAVPNKFTAQGKPASYELVREGGTEQRTIPGSDYIGLYEKGSGRYLGMVPPKTGAPPPAMTQDDIEAARAAGAEVTVKQGSTTLKLPPKTNKPKATAAPRVIDLPVGEGPTATTGKFQWDGAAWVPVKIGSAQGAAAAPAKLDVGSSISRLLGNQQ